MIGLAAPAAHRIHRRLLVEELEPRIAPAILSAAHPIVHFTDTSGDTVAIRFGGPGQADVQWVAGGDNPSDSDEIASIAFSGTMPSSALVIEDTNPAVGGNSLIGGSIGTDGSESFGSIRFLAPHGSASSTAINIFGNLTTLFVSGDAVDLDLTVGGNLGQEIIRGNATDCDTSVGNWLTSPGCGGVKLIHVLGNAATTNFTVTLNAVQVTVDGEFISSTLGIGGTTNAVRIAGAMNGSAITAGELKYFCAASLNSSTVQGIASIGEACCRGDMTNSLFVANGSSGVIRIQGDVTCDPAGADAVQVVGSLAQLAVDGNVSGGRFNIAGDLALAQIKGSMENSRITTGGNLQEAVIGGHVSSDSSTTFEIGGSGGSTRILGDVTNTVAWAGGDLTQLSFAGSVSGTYIWTAGAIGEMLIAGSCAGSQISWNGTCRSIQVLGALDSTTLNYDGGGSLMSLRAGFMSGVSAALPALNQVYCMGAMADSTISSGCSMTICHVGGDVTGSTIAVGPEDIWVPANMGQLIVNGNVSSATFKITGDLALAKIAGGRGKTIESMTLNVGGSLGKGLFQGPMNSSTLSVHGKTGLAQFMGGVADSFVYLAAWSPCGTDRLVVNGALTSTEVMIGGNVDDLIIVGPIQGGSNLTVGGTTRLFQVAEGIKDSYVYLTQVSVARVAATASEPAIAGDLSIGALGKSLAIAGDLAGQVDVGNANGASIQIVGDLTGGLTGVVFGNVTIVGSFSGWIGDEYQTTAGTGNTLRVSRPGGGGMVTPYPEAFARYIGYS